MVEPPEPGSSCSLLGCLQPSGIATVAAYHKLSMSSMPCTEVDLAVSGWHESASALEDLFVTGCVMQCETQQKAESCTGCVSN